MVGDKDLIISVGREFIPVSKISILYTKDMGLYKYGDEFTINKHYKETKDLFDVIGDKLYLLNIGEIGVEQSKLVSFIEYIISHTMVNDLYDICKRKETIAEFINNME